MHSLLYIEYYSTGSIIDSGSSTKYLIERFPVPVECAEKEEGAIPKTRIECNRGLRPLRISAF
eukprot:SAG11_NODE_592_length_8310_cov_3.191868_1_plen_63_part_00